MHFQSLGRRSDGALRGDAPKRALRQVCSEHRRGPDFAALHVGPPGVGPASYPFSVSDSNYLSGDDYVIEFLGYRFGFNAVDFEQRVNTAAVRLGLVEPGELDPGESWTSSS